MNVKDLIDKLQEFEPELKILGELAIQEIKVGSVLIDEEGAIGPLLDAGKALSIKNQDAINKL